MLVACVATANFLPPVSAMLHSLGSSSREPVEVLLLHDGELPEDGRARVAATAETCGVDLRFVPLPEQLLEGFPEVTFPRAIWGRVFLGELLPDVDRVLYLDADTLVLDDLSELWNTDVSGRPFAAVANPIYKFLGNWPRYVLGIDEPRHYINSGVLLMNLAFLREDGSAERLRRYAIEHPESLCPDQDALSVLFHDRHVPLHPRWNAQTTLFELRDDELPFTTQEIAEARRDPAIVHFIGPFKPWHQLCAHPYKDAYFDHLAATPWPRPAIEGRTVYNRFLSKLSATGVNRGLRWRAAVRRAVGRR